MRCCNVGQIAQFLLVMAFIRFQSGLADQYECIDDVTVNCHRLAGSTFKTRKKGVTPQSWEVCRDWCSQMIQPYCSSFTWYNYPVGMCKLFTTPCEIIVLAGNTSKYDSIYFIPNNGQQTVKKYCYKVLPTSTTLSTTLHTTMPTTTRQTTAPSISSKTATSMGRSSSTTYATTVNKRTSKTTAGQSTGQRTSLSGKTSTKTTRWSSSTQSSSSIPSWAISTTTTKSPSSSIATSKTITKVSPTVSRISLQFTASLTTKSTASTSSKLSKTTSGTTISTSHSVETSSTRSTTVKTTTMQRISSSERLTSEGFLSTSTTNTSDSGDTVSSGSGNGEISLTSVAGFSTSAGNDTEITPQPSVQAGFYMDWWWILLFVLCFLALICLVLLFVYMCLKRRPRKRPNRPEKESSPGYVSPLIPPGSSQSSTPLVPSEFEEVINPSDYQESASYVNVYV